MLVQPFLLLCQENIWIGPTNSLKRFFSNKGGKQIKVTATIAKLMWPFINGNVLTRGIRDSKFHSNMVSGSFLVNGICVGKVSCWLNIENEIAVYKNDIQSMQRGCGEVNQLNQKSTSYQLSPMYSN